MEQARFDRVMALFEEFLELPVEERARRLQERCGDDEELRKMVESLLEHVLNRPIPQRAGRRSLRTCVA